MNDPAEKLRPEAGDVSGDAKRSARAARRRQGYPGRVVKAGTPKPPLYSELTLVERLAHMTALTRRQFALSGDAQRPPARSEWPGEIIRLDGR